MTEREPGIRPKMGYQITPKIWQKIKEKPSSTCLKLTSPRFRVSDPSLVFYRSSIYLFIFVIFPDMEYLEVLTEGLERVLMVRGGGREVITIYS